MERRPELDAGPLMPLLTPEDDDVAADIGPSTAAAPVDDASDVPESATEGDDHSDVTTTPRPHPCYVGLRAFGCLFCMLAATAAEVDALRRGWSATWIVFAAGLGHLVWLRSASYVSKLAQVWRPEEQPRLCPVPWPAAQPQKPVVVRTDSRTEQIVLRPAEPQQFYLELVDISLPPAFLCVLTSILPLAVLQHSILTTTSPSATVSLLPATLIAAATLTTTCARLISKVGLAQQMAQKRRSAVFSWLHQESQGGGGLYSLLSNGALDQRRLESLEELGTEMPLTASLTLVLGPLAADSLAPSPTLTFFEEEKQRQLFGAEATTTTPDAVQAQYYAGIPIAPSTRTGFMYACLDLLVDLRTGFGEFCLAAVRSKQIPALIILSLGCLCVILIEHSWVVAASVGLYGLFVALLKSALFAQPFLAIRSAVPALLEYNLVLVQLTISSLLLLLSLQQLVFETIFVRDTLSWKIKGQRSWPADCGVLLAASISRLLANRTSQTIASSEGPPVFRWVEIVFVTLWFVAAETYKVVVVERGPSGVVQELKLAKWGLGFGRLPVAARSVVATCLIAGLVYSVILRNRSPIVWKEEEEEEEKEEAATEEAMPVKPSEEEEELREEVPAEEEIEGRVPPVLVIERRESRPASPRIIPPISLEMITRPGGPIDQLGPPSVLRHAASRAEEKRGNVMEISRLDQVPPQLRPTVAPPPPPPPPPMPITPTILSPRGPLRRETRGRTVSPLQEAIQMRRAFRISKQPPESGKRKVPQPPSKEPPEPPKQRGGEPRRPGRREPPKRPSAPRDKP